MPHEHRPTADQHHASSAPGEQPTTGRLPVRRRLVPVLALLVLAPWAAECSWGGFTLDDFLPVVVFLGPMYGGAAILIRETARHLGGGWPVIVLLAAAFGVVQAGLVDQSLFNPDYLDDTEYADTQAAAAATLVPGLEFSVWQAFDYVGNHIMLTICAPIAIVESYLGAGRRLRPWLGRPGLVVVALLWLAGSLLIFSDESGRKGFLASPLQLAFAVALAAALIGAALLPRWRSLAATRTARAPRPVLVALLVLVAHLGTALTPGWVGVGIALAVAVVVGGLIVRWSGRAGWGQRHVLAAGSASVISAAAFAYLVPPYAPASPAAALTGDIAVSVVTFVLIGGAWWRLRRASPTVHVPAS
ncbi:hypothetical protein [Micromonospora sp. NPDC051006]|uniref:hypothetical protein n=1 Tax=Micromonospora sp. NPDC051006 TaxID=3364283 RepID=UPI0037B6E161